MFKVRGIVVNRLLDFKPFGCYLSPCKYKYNNIFSETKIFLNSHFILILLNVFLKVCFIIIINSVFLINDLQGRAVTNRGKLWDENQAPYMSKYASKKSNLRLHK